MFTMRYAPVLVVTLTLFRAAEISGSEINEGNRKKETDGLLEVFPNIGKNIRDKLKTISMQPSDEVELRGGSRLSVKNNKENAETLEIVDELFNLRSDGTLSYQSVQDAFQELAKSIQAIKGEAGSAECKQHIMTLLRRIIMIFLKLISKIIVYIMSYLDSDPDY